MSFKARFLGRAVFGLVAIAVLGGVVMLLWNAIIPGLFVGAQAIDFLHALGLLVLSRILFGGFRGHGGWRGRRHGWQRERWAAMTTEERERFKACGPWGRRAAPSE